MTKTLFLDIDGTLVDSNDAHARAWVTAFQDEGISVDFAQVRPLIGMGADQLVPRLTGIQKDDPVFKRLSDGWKRAFEGEVPELRAFPGTRQLVQAARNAGWQLLVATSGEADLADRLLRLADVADLLPMRVSSQDAEASKPEPDLMHAALEKAGVPPGDAWMLGDTHFDVEAAHKAGVRCAVVRLGGNGGLDEADRVFDDLPAVTAWLTAPPTPAADR